MVDTIKIIAQATPERVASRAAIERVIARAAGNAVRASVARAGEIAGTAEYQIFDIARKCIGCCGRHDGVGAAVNILDNRITGLCDNIGIVPRTAAQRVVATTPRECIVAAAACDAVVRCVAGAREISNP